MVTLTTNNAPPAAPPGATKVEAKPPKLADGRVLCLKLGTATARGAYEHPSKLYAGTFKLTDLICAETYGRRCLPGQRGGSQ